MIFRKISGWYIFDNFFLKHIQMETFKESKVQESAVNVFK